MMQRAKDHKTQVQRLSEEPVMHILHTKKGGPGSGDFGHEGRPGDVGGSGGGGGDGSSTSGDGKFPSPEERIAAIKEPTVIRPGDPLHDAAVDKLRNECLNSAHPQMLTHYDHADLKDVTIIISNGGKTGCAVANNDSPKEGDFIKDELIGVYNNSGEHGVVGPVVREGINEGAVALHCFDGVLPDIYSHYGFSVTGESYPFDDKLAPTEGVHNAPKDWDKIDNRPDYVTMALGAGKERHASYTFEPTEFVSVLDEFRKSLKEAVIKR